MSTINPKAPLQVVQEELTGTLTDSMQTSMNQLSSFKNVRKSNLKESSASMSQSLHIEKSNSNVKVKRAYLRVLEDAQSTPFKK